MAKRSSYQWMTRIAGFIIISLGELLLWYNLISSTVSDLPNSRHVTGISENVFTIILFCWVLESGLFFCHYTSPRSILSKQIHENPVLKRLLSDPSPPFRERKTNILSFKSACLMQQNCIINHTWQLNTLKNLWVHDSWVTY